MNLLTDLGLDPSFFLITLGIATVVTIGLYSRFIINAFDQILFFMLSAVACDSLVFGFPWDPELKTHYIWFAVSFWLGFAIRGKVNRSPAAFRIDLRAVRSLELVLTLLFLLLFFSNLYVGFTAGFPLFSHVPDAAKVTIYQGGLGIVRRLNMTPFVFFVSGCTLLMVINHKRRRFFVMLLVGCMLILLTGSKAALVPLVGILGLVIAHNGLMRGRKFLAKSLSHYALIAYFVAGGLAFLILVIDAGGGGFRAAFDLLATRLLFNGDVILYYFPTKGNNLQLMGLNWVDYLAYLFKGMLATLRITKEYPPALGSIIMGTDLVGFGPNPLYFVRAEIFFGPRLGCLYCALIGYGCSFLRRIFFTRSSVSIESAAIRLTLAASAFNLAVDSASLVGGLVDLIVLVGPLWVVARGLMLTGRIDSTREAITTHTDVSGRDPRPSSTPQIPKSLRGESFYE